MPPHGWHSDSRKCRWHHASSRLSSRLRVSSVAHSLTRHARVRTTPPALSPSNACVSLTENHWRKLLHPSFALDCSSFRGCTALGGGIGARSWRLTPLSQRVSCTVSGASCWPGLSGECAGSLPERTMGMAHGPRPRRERIQWLLGEGTRQPVGAPDTWGLLVRLTSCTGVLKRAVRE